MVTRASLVQRVAPFVLCLSLVADYLKPSSVNGPLVVLVQIRVFLKGMYYPQTSRSVSEILYSHNLPQMQNGEWNGDKH